MAMILQSCQPTKSGRAWRCMVGGTYYNAFKDSGIEKYVGQMIEIDIQTSEKFGPSISAFRPVAGPAIAAPGANSPAGGSPASTPPVAAPQYATQNTNVAPWWWPSVSNTWAAAIAAGIIKEPQDLKVWAMAVKGAAKAATAATVATQDEDIPF